MQEMHSGGAGPARESPTTNPGRKSIIRWLFRRSPLHWLVLSGVLLIVMLVTGTALTVVNFRDRAIDNSERELKNTAALLAGHFDQQLQDIEVVQKQIAVQMRTEGVSTAAWFKLYMSREDIHAVLKTKIDAMPYVGSLNVFDADGILINSSREWPTPPISVADRPHFKLMKADPSLERTLTEPMHSRVTGQWTVVIARRISGPNGEFLGLVTRGIEPGHFENFFASLALDASSTISLFHSGGTLLASYPQNGDVIGQNFKDDPIFRAIAPAQLRNAMVTVGPLDARERIAVVDKLELFPISVVASKTVDSVLADWREQTRFLISVAALCGIVIVVLLFLIVRKLSAHHRYIEQRLALEKLRLSTAIDNMTIGLLLFDKWERIVVCNQRYIDMYGLSPDVAKPGCSFRNIIAHRHATGSFKGDVDAYCELVLRDRHHEQTKIVETADGRFIQVATRPLADGGWVATHEDITERRRSEERIAHLAHFDALTDLPNRVMFGERLARELARIQRGGQFAVLYIDIDEFKGINDSLGHPVGDELLKAVSARLQACLRETDFVARLGGDEFAIIQTSIDRPTDATELVERIYRTLRQPFACLGHQITTDASIGIALAPADGDNIDQLLKNADLAMYGAKADGRRTCRFFEPEMDARVKRRHQLELDLRQIIADGQFAQSGLDVYYQPIVNLRDDRVVGCEALLRWRHPERGMISPAEFIPVAEDTGLIAALGEWVLETACREAATWPDHIRIAVNVSPVQFKSGTLGLNLARILAASGLAPGRLELEITEAVLIRDDEAALAILHQFRGVGVRIALDDFGTGYSSLSYLQRFPFDKIKIDRCFVNDIGADDGSSSIVQAVVTIAAARNMTTTAEGVETAQQRELLRLLGCTEMQGYLFSPARPATDIARLLADRATDGSVRAAVA